MREQWKAIRGPTKELAIVMLVLLILGCLGARVWNDFRAMMPVQPIVLEAVPEDFDAELFKKVATILNEQASPGVRVQIAVRQMDDQSYLGLTMYLDELDMFLVQIEANQSMAGILDTLIHEWAHIMVAGSVQESDHDALWGVAYARAYRIALPVAEDQ